jgi:hypothetical protein
MTRPRIPVWIPAGDPAAPPPNVDLRPLALDAAGRPARLMMVRATHRMTGLTRTALSFDAIRDALAGINWNDSPGGVPLPPSLQALPAIPTRWVGPVPRVIRRGSDASAAQETEVAWPLLLEPASTTTDAQVGAAQQNRKALIERALARLSGTADEPAGGWSGASLVTYGEALHGPLTWWQSGAAGRTRTFERFPAVTEVDAQENPQGPTTADLQNPDYLTWLRENAPAVTGFSWGAVVGGGVVLAGVVALLARVGGGSREVVIRTEQRGRRALVASRER